MQRTKGGKLSAQVRRHSQKKPDKENQYDGDVSQVISTGSTLLDLAICGERIEGGGIPGGILVEVFGPSGAGKTALLSEIAGDVQRKGGEIMFHDPEARLTKQFARIFGLNTDEMNYSTPDRVPDVFKTVRKWEPDDKSYINGVFTDSLAALSTNLEMDNEDGDKMGMRRAKEFSEECRKTCRILAKENILMVCSNQVRVNQDAGPYGQKYRSPGGEAIPFYSSLRLKCSSPIKMKDEKHIKGKKVKRVVGVETEIEVFKSSVGKPFRTAPIFILFDYGIDDIRANLRFVKQVTGNTVYAVRDTKLSNSMDQAIVQVEEDKLEKKLKAEVTELWHYVESKFKQNRKRKRRV